MNPQTRKTNSESKLRALGVPVNESLPMIEAASEIEIRSADEVLRRLIALWAVVDKAFLGLESKTESYIVANRMQTWLSDGERSYLLKKQPEKREGIHFSWQLEALYFVAWCAGLLESSEVPNEESSVKSILTLFPNEDEQPDRLQAAIRLRTKDKF